MNTLLEAESSSGCESGWTSYLDHDSFCSPYPSHSDYFMSNEKRAKNEEDEDEEEDLSMVSDASSGPPHLQDEEDDAGLFYHAPANPTLPIYNSGKMKKNKGQQHRRRKVQEQQPCVLDDTASSPIFNFNSNNLTLTNNQDSLENVIDFSQGHSTTHFQGKSRFQEHYGFFPSPVSGPKLQQDQWFERRKVGMR